MGKGFCGETYFNEVNYLSIIITIIIFGIIVMIHEWGHFIAARKCGVFVEEFAIGMGPKIWSVKKNETVYSIRIFPIGGFCKMAEDDTEGSDKKGFNNIAVWKKMIIVLAGVFMNFILAWIIMSAIISAAGFTDNQVREVVSGSPAADAGIISGDRIVELNGSSIHIYDDLSFEMMNYSGGEISISIDRNGENIEKIITPVKNENGRFIIGFTFEYRPGIFGEKYEVYETAGIFETLKAGFWNMIYMIKVTFAGVVSLFTMQVSMDEVAGPIGLTTVVDEVYTETVSRGIFETVVSMSNIAALLSANLGVMNLLPIPALDGGRFIFLIIEFIRRKPMPPEREGMIHFVGFAILMIFGLFIAFNDIFKLIY